MKMKRSWSNIFMAALITLIISISYYYLILHPNEKIEKMRDAAKLATQEKKPGEWPLWRRDVRNTGQSSLKGNISFSPVIIGKYFLGGQVSQLFIYDVNNDCEKDLLIVYGGKVSMKNLEGTEIWASPALEISEILGVYDLDENGFNDIVAISNSPPSIYVLSGINGSLEWEYRFSPPVSSVGVFGIKIVDIVPSIRGMELIVWPAKSEYGYVFSFSDGLNNGKVLYKMLAQEALNYPPPLIVDDINLDGILDVTIATVDWLYVFDGVNGSLKQKVPILMNRNYGHLILANVDEDPYPEIFILADSLNEHITFVQNSNGLLHKEWSKFFEYSYPTDYITLKPTINSVCDIDLDGKLEIVCSIYNGTGDSRWHLIAFDTNGTVKLDLLDTYLWGLQDVDGDNSLEIFISEERTRNPSFFSTTKILKCYKGQVITLWSLGNSHLISEVKSLMDLDLSASTITGRDEVLVRSINCDAKRFFTITSSGVKAFDFMMNGTALCKWQFPETLNVLGMKSDTDGSIRTLGQKGDGFIYYINEEGKIDKKLVCGGFLGSVPIAVKLNNRNMSIIVQNSMGEIIALQLEKEGEVKVLWKIGGTGKSAKYGRGYSVVVADLDKDGFSEVIVGNTTGLLILNFDGTIKRALSLDGIPFEWTIGNFNGDEVLDIFVSFYAGGYHVAKSYMLDGKSSNLLWEKPYGPHSGYVAVFDVDGDGVDDVILREHFELHIINGKTGEEMVRVSELCGYHTPIIVDVDGDCVMDIVWGAGWGSLVVDQIVPSITGIETKERWRRLYGGGDSTEIYGRMPGVADLNNDGHVEIVVSSLNMGVLYCYDGVTGDIKWQYNFGTVASDITTGDVDGDGRIELIFGATDGRLYCLKYNGEVMWTYYFGYSVGTPIIADVDEDGLGEIIVCASDGYIYILDSTFERS